MIAHVVFCDESFQVAEGGVVTVGREGDLKIDDNPYLHRIFLSLSVSDGYAWLHNVGAQIAATVADADGLTQTWLAPGARIPLVFPRTRVWFSAGPTTYDLDINVDAAPMIPTSHARGATEETTIGPVSMTPDQRLLVLALAEPVLLRGLGGRGSIPSSTAAARRLGWTTTKFNRKLDNMCDKLARTGVTGLVGSSGAHASSRRTRLVEYAVATRLITADDLLLLES